MHHRAQQRQRLQPLRPPPPHLRAHLHPQVRRQRCGVRHDARSGVDRGERHDEAGDTGQDPLRLPHLAGEGRGPGLGHRLPARRRPHHRPPHRRQLHHPALHQRRDEAPHTQGHVLIILSLISSTNSDRSNSLYV